MFVRVLGILILILLLNGGDIALGEQVDAGTDLFGIWLGLAIVAAAVTFSPLFIILRDAIDTDRSKKLACWQQSILAFTAAWCVAVVAYQAWQVIAIWARIYNNGHLPSDTWTLTSTGLWVAFGVLIAFYVVTAFSIALFGLSFRRDATHDMLATTLSVSWIVLTAGYIVLPFITNYGPRIVGVGFVSLAFLCVAVCFWMTAVWAFEGRDRRSVEKARLAAEEIEQAERESQRRASELANSDVQAEHFRQRRSRAEQMFKDDCELRWQETQRAIDAVCDHGRHNPDLEGRSLKSVFRQHVREKLTDYLRYAVERLSYYMSHEQAFAAGRDSLAREKLEFEQEFRLEERINEEVQRQLNWGKKTREQLDEELAKKLSEIDRDARLDTDGKKWAKEKIETAYAKSIANLMIEEFET